MSVIDLSASNGFVTYGENASKSLQCVFAVQQEAELELTGTNKVGGNYKYATHADIMRAIRPHLMKHECVVMFSIVGSSCDGGYQKVQGSKDAQPKDRLVTVAHVAIEARLVYTGDNKDYVAVSSFGFKVDQTSDKALGAQTIATRYALLALFGLPSSPSGEDDPDHDSSDVRRVDMFGGMQTVPKSHPAAEAVTAAESKTQVSMMDFFK